MPVAPSFDFADPLAARPSSFSEESASGNGKRQFSAGLVLAY